MIAKVSKPMNNTNGNLICLSKMSKCTSFESTRPSKNPYKGENQVKLFDTEKQFNGQKITACKTELKHKNHDFTNTVHSKPVQNPQNPSFHLYLRSNIKIKT